MKLDLKTWQYRIFYLTLFLLPANLAKHFIGQSSYVSGILVDYLVPAIYLTDILILVLLIFNKGPTFVKIVKSGFFVFLLALLPSVIFATSPLPAIYKWLKLLELSLFAIWVKQYIDIQKHINTIINVLSASVLFQSLLALAQWLKQSSLFGYWFLGEQPYSSATVGMDKITWWDGSLRLPPLGTTPHPNVLAGLIVVLLPFILKGLSLRKSEVRPYWKIFYLTTIIFALITLFLTFSLSAWLALLLIITPTYLFYFPQGLTLRKRRLVLSGYAVFTVSLIFGFWSQFNFLAPESSFSRRSQLAGMAVSMVKDSPLVGVGLNNFTVVMESYGHISATTRFLQPVHNIYLLILAEAGLLGLVGLGYLLICALRSKRPPVVKLSLLVLLFLGLFDHYPLTLQQGLLMFFLLV